MESILWRWGLNDKRRMILAYKYKLLLNDEGLWKITSPFYNAFILQI